MAWLILAGIAAPAGAAAVRLSSPRDGTTLEAGSLAALAWEPAAPFARPSQVEEWEAFLSFDGGEHYPVRITPHLDRGLRRILWRVPQIPTRNARLLLRFGDEKHETIFELPERFAIAGTLSVFEAGTTSRAPAPGEPARPGDAGVVAWVEGSRHGGALRQVVAADAAGLAGSQSMAPDPAWRLALASVSRSPEPEPLLETGRLGQTDLDQAASATSPRAVRPAPIPILLLTRRQNE